MPRAFASDTSVPVDRTRAEINKLLRDWQCSSLSWADHILEQKVAVEFTWHKDGTLYRVRFTIGIPDRMEVRGRHPRSRYDNKDGKYYATLNEDEKGQAWRAAHRLLLLKLKADLNAAEAGLARAEEVFLPWIVDHNGKTVAEVLLPRLREAYAALPPGNPPPEGT